MGQGVNFEIDGHHERSAFEVGGPKRGRDCVFLKTVDGVMGSKIDKCGEVVDGNANNEVDDRREGGVIEKSGPNVDGKVNSEKMLPRRGFEGVKPHAGPRGKFHTHIHTL